MVVGKPGDIVLNVPLNKAAWHAGLARIDFNGDGDFNDSGEMYVNSSTWGIEVVGSYGGPWPNRQMYSVAYLIRRADRKCKNFGLRNITDHAAVNLNGKVDVSSTFPAAKLFWWILHPRSPLPSGSIYAKLPEWAQRQVDEIKR